jgi:cytochrome P450
MIPTSMTRIRVASAPPGPKGMPILGNQPKFQQNRLDFLLRQREYGDLVRFSRLLYLVNSPILAEEVFKHSNETYTITRTLRDQKTGGTRESEDLVEWMRARHVAGWGLNRRSLRGAEDRIAHTVARHADSWRVRGHAEMIPELEDLTANLIAEYCLGEEIGPIPGLVARFQDSLVPNPVVGRARWFVPRTRRLDAVYRTLCGEVSERVQQRSRQQSQPHPVLADVLIAARDDGALSHQGVVRMLVSNLFAAHETTAAALAWLFLLLDRHDEIRRRVHAEIDQVLGDRVATTEDLPRLTVIEGVVKETLRLYPSLWLIVRTVEKSTELGGYPVRPGQFVAVSPFVLHRDPRSYDRPQEFRPDRWLEPSDTTLHKYAFMPFSGGPRICLGTHFAMAVMVITAATVLGRYRLRRAPGCTPVLSPHTILQPQGLVMGVTERG